MEADHSKFDSEPEPDFAEPSSYLQQQWRSQVIQDSTHSDSSAAQYHPHLSSTRQSPYTIDMHPTGTTICAQQFSSTRSRSSSTMLHMSMRVRMRMQVRVFLDSH